MSRPRCSDILSKTCHAITRRIVCIAAYCLGVLFLSVLGVCLAISKAKLALIQAVLRLCFDKPLDVLSGLDAVIWHAGRSWFVDPMCLQVVTTALVVKGAPNVPKLKALVRERLVDARDRVTGRSAYPRFTQHITRKFGYFVWEDDGEFTMKHRVRLWRRGYSNKASLISLLQELYQKPFDKGHSPWELLLLPKVSQNDGATDEYIVLLRIFHSLGDGVQMLRICESLFDNQTKEKPSTYYDDLLLDVPVSRMPVQFRCNPFLRYLRDTKAAVTSQERNEILINGLKTALMAPWHLTELMVQKKESNYTSQLNIPVALFTGRKILAYTERIDLSLFKKITAAYGCTINDVYLHCLTGAYQKSNDPSAQKVLKDVPTIYTNISTPINLLPKSGFWSENCFADLMMTLPSSSVDPAARLKEIAGICHATKSSTAATGQLLLIQALGNHLPSVIAKFTFADSLNLELGATNLRGPDTDGMLGNEEVIDMFLAANNLGNAAVAFSFLSYNGGARIGVTVDRVVAPDDGIAQRIADNFVEELDNLFAMATTVSEPHV